MSSSSDESEVRSRTDSCPACGATEGSPRFERAKHHYLQCTECGWMRLSPMPSDEQLRAIYDEDYFEHGKHAGYASYRAEEAIHRRNAAVRCARLARDLPAPARLLEYGCAYGYGLDAAKRRGYSAVGVELSEYAAAQAEQTGHQVVSSIEQIPDEQQFDAALMFQVLEHLARPQEHLVAMHRRLRPEGLLLIETWDLDSWIARLCGGAWQQISPPSVVHLFHRNGLEKLLTRSGFELLRWERTSKRVAMTTVLTQLAEKQPMLFGALSRFWGRSSARSRIAIPYALGDLVTATAVRSNSPTE